MTYSLIQFYDKISRSHRQTKVKVGQIESVKANEDIMLSELATSIIAKNKCIGNKFVSDVKDCLEQIYSHQFIHASKSAIEDVKTSDVKGASIKSLRLYLDLLYGDTVNNKIQGSLMILELCKDVDNIDIIIEDQQLMSALSRTLLDHLETSNLVIFHISRICLALSSFNELQPLLTDLRIGGTIIKMVKKQLEIVEKAKIVMFDIV